nr:unnamed protein product [Spirometra erinaceieuropaei]
MEWAEQNHLSWPPHFLDNLLSFQKFLDGIATAGPFRSLLHLALVFSKSEGISVRQLLPKVQENVVINLVEEEEANESGAECQFILDRQGDLSDTDSTERLTSAVERFNLFIDSLTVGLKAAVGSPEGPPSRGLPWNLLRQFEKNLLRDLRCSEKTLLTLLADACDPDKDVARPVYLFPKSLASRPGILHLAQPLLSKSATTVECCFVVVVGVVDVGFVQSVFLGDQIADDGVVVTELVLLLTTWESEDSHRRCLDCISQFIPSVLLGGALIIIIIIIGGGITD